MQAVASPTKFGLALVAPVAILLILLVIYPVGYSFYLSLISVNPLTGVSRFVGVANYADVLQDPRVWNALGITLYYVTCVTVLSLAIGKET